MNYRAASLLLLVCCAMMTYGQEITIQVIDDQGSPIYGAEIITGEVPVATTDLEGYARWDYRDAEAPYTISALGYEDRSIDEVPSDEELITIVMPSVARQLKTVEVTGSRSAVGQRSPYHIQRLAAEQLKSIASQTTVEGLERSGSVYVQRSQMGGGSPVLRGFEANRVLLVVDGVRLNNAIYRSGHLQNALSVDQAVLDAMTVWFGPGSLIYGSDALGGVIHFETKQPSFYQGEGTQVSGGYYARYASANEERSLHGHIEMARRRWSALTSVTATRYGDLRMGSRRSDDYPDFGKRTWYVDPPTDSVRMNADENVQRHTGYDQIDVLHKQRFALSSSQFLTLNAQYSNTSDVPRYDELSLGTAEAPVFSEWYYGPQQRWLASMKYDVERQRFAFHRMQIQAHYQHISEDRHQRRYRDPYLISNEERVQVYGLNIDLTKRLTPEGAHKLTYGGTARYHDVASTAQREDRRTGVIDQETFTRYPDDQADMYDAGVYAHYRWQGDRHEVQAGLRYSYQHLEVAFRPSELFDWPAFFISGVAQTSHRLDWMLSGRWKLAEQLWIRGSTGTAFRAPNIDDFAKVRVKVGERISVPNTDLSAERTWNADLGIDLFTSWSTTKSLELGLTGYYTRITDAIIRLPATLPSGDSVYVNDGVPLDVEANFNADEGYIWGVSGQMKCQWKDWQLAAAAGYQYGRSTMGDREQPLAHIPPLYGQATMTYKRPRWSVAGSVHFNGRKRLEDFAPNSSDNIEFATPEGSLAWAVVHLHGTYAIHPKLDLRLGLENVGDLHYRSFSSGVSAPGRQVKVGVYGRF